MEIRTAFNPPVHYVAVMAPGVRLERIEQPDGPPIVISRSEIQSYFVSTSSAPGPGQPHYTTSDILMRMIF